MTTKTIKQLEVLLDEEIISGTETDRLHGENLALELIYKVEGDTEEYKVRFDGIQEGLRVGTHTVNAHLSFTLNKGLGTTILVPLNTTIEELLAVVNNKAKIIIKIKEILEIQGGD